MSTKMQITLNAREVNALDELAVGELRRHISHAVAVESSRGWRLAKTKRSNKSDLAVALGMSAWAAMQEQSQPFEILGAW